LKKQGDVTDTTKPHRPKEALLAALRHVGVPFSPSIFQRLTEKVSPYRNAAEVAAGLFDEVLATQREVVEHPVASLEVREGSTRE
jgi:hypothetical protein